MREIGAQELRIDFLSLVREAQERGRPADSLLIGQPRALRALNLGLEIHSRGYHILVSGPSGTGRMTALRRILENLPPLQPLQDQVFVANFQEPDRPRLLVLPAGKAGAFRESVENLVRQAAALVRSGLENKELARLRDSSERDLNAAAVRELVEFEAQAESLGLRVVQTSRTDEEGPLTEILPVHENQVLDWDEFRALVAAGTLTQQDYDQRRERYLQLSQEFGDLLHKIDERRFEIRRGMERLTREHVRKQLRRLVKAAAKPYPQPEVQAFFQELEADILDNVGLFQQDLAEGERPGGLRYAVHVLVDHSRTTRAPVVFETRCDVYSLLGSIDVKVEANNEVRAHFTQIRPGALIRAHGGYLVLRLEDLTANRRAWQALIRCLDTGLVDLPAPQNPFGPLPGALKPQSVPLLVKVILVGPEGSYDYLSASDPNFLRLFKISAEFDSEMESSTDTVAEYLRFIESQREQKKLLPLDPSGLARVVEYGHRITGNRRKLSTQFSLIADILTEANHWAHKEGRPTIDAQSVQRALSERAYMFSRAEEAIDEEWRRGRLLITLEGQRIGEANGLAVIDRGFYRFGRPIRITARCSPGRGGIVNIEGKAGLSGRIHTKSVLILEGLLRSLFAPNEPFHARLSLAVEQNYGGIEGDSASTAEACALLSALAQVPFRQDIALTGSINQAGEVQAVGGLTEKVEGFFALCRKKGLAGQGVIIPECNRDDLILEDAVLRAVEAGRFHIWAVSHLSEAVHLLGGLEMGTPDDEGRYPEGSLGGLVQRRLALFRSVAPSDR